MFCKQFSETGSPNVQFLALRNTVMLLCGMEEWIGLVASQEYSINLCLMEVCRETKEACSTMNEPDRKPSGDKQGIQKGCCEGVL